MNKTTLDTAAALKLQTLARDNGEFPFVHLVTQALGGDPWAEQQVVIAINDIDYVLDMGGEFTGKRIADDIRLDVIRNAETTRPDGAVARSFQV